MADFEDKREEARELLDKEGVTAFHVSVVRGDRVETVSERNASADRAESLQVLSLLAAHIGAAADSAGADYDEVAGNAAAIAGQIGSQALTEPDDDE